MNKLKKIFWSKKSKEPQTTETTINGLREMEEMLTKKQTYLEERIHEQVSLAKKHGLKNKNAALMALKRKKRFEQMLLQVDGTLTTLELQRETLEQAKNNVSVLHAMKTAATSLKAAQDNLDVDKIHDVMDDIAEQQDVAREISDAISNPLSNSLNNVDDSELEKELEELEQEELDKELLQIPGTKHADPFEAEEEDPKPNVTRRDSSPSVPPMKKKSAATTEEDKELAALAQWASTI